MTKKIDPKLIHLWEAAKQVFGDWKPTSYQRCVFENVFIHDKRYVFEEWSRGGGKTVTALKLAFLAALLYPGRSILYVAPTHVDGIKIIEDKYSSEFPHHLLAKSSSSTGVFRFKNGSRLVITGSEGNPHQGKGNVGRGLEPVLIIYDEFAYHNKKAHESLAPTLRNDGRLVIISTPPRLDDMDNGKADHYDKMIELCKTEEWASYHQVTCDKLVEEGVCNADFLQRIEADYTSRGEHDEFLGEYWLKRVHRSRDSVFKDIDNSILLPIASMTALVEQVVNPLWITVGDSSGSTRWGSLFACLDEDKGQLYLVDSIICKREGINDTEQRLASGLSPTLYWPKVQHRMQKALPGKDETHWHILWDHETIFIDIIPQLFGFHIIIDPVEKQKDKKPEVFALIRDLINTNRLFISESCAELIVEMKMLSINPKTHKYVKELDELLDCLRYIIMAYDYVFQNKPIEVVTKIDFITSVLNNHYRDKMKKEENIDSILQPGDWW